MSPVPALLAALLSPTERLWASEDLFLDSHGHVWQRGEDGAPAKEPEDIGAVPLGAGPSYDGGIVVFVSEPSGCRLLKVTLSRAKPGILVTRGHPMKGGPVGGNYAVFPFRSGDTVVQQVGKGTGWLYSKGTVWSSLALDPSRSRGVVQAGTAFWPVGGTIYANGLERFRGQPLASAAGGRVVFQSATGEGGAVRLVPNDSAERVSWMAPGEVVMELSVGGPSPTVSLGPAPAPNAVVAHDRKGNPFFAYLSPGHRLTVVPMQAR